jgi:hypothetical protein
MGDLEVMDRIILGVSSTIVGLGTIIGSYILFPPPPPMRLTVVFCTTMTNISPNYNGMILTIIGIVFVGVGIFIGSSNWVKQK